MGGEPWEEAGRWVVSCRRRQGGELQEEARASTGGQDTGRIILGLQIDLGPLKQAVSDCG